MNNTGQTILDEQYMNYNNSSLPPPTVSPQRTSDGEGLGVVVAQQNQVVDALRQSRVGLLALLTDEFRRLPVGINDLEVQVVKKSYAVVLLGTALAG